METLMKLDYKELILMAKELGLTVNLIKKHGELRYKKTYASAIFELIRQCHLDGRYPTVNALKETSEIMNTMESVSHQEVSAND